MVRALLGAVVAACVTACGADTVTAERGDAGDDAPTRADVSVDGASDRPPPTPVARCPMAPPPLPPATPEPTVVSMSAVVTHECAVYRDTTVRCSGQNYNGELGNGTTTPAFDRPIAVPDLRGVRQIVTNQFRATYAVLDDGTVRSWGDNTYALLGRTSSNPSCEGGQPCDRRPGLVPGLHDVTSLVTGTFGTCVIERDGSVWCWGLVLGLTRDRVATPIRVDDGAEVRELIDIGLDVILRRADGTLVPEASWRPFGARIDPAWAIAPGHGGHLCATLPDLTVRCWGLNADAKVGNGNAMFPGDETQPQDVGLDCVRSVARGHYHTCAIRTDGTVWCWGLNDDEQAGVPLAESDDCPGINGPTRCVRRPRQVQGLDHVEALFLGYSRSCALRSDRTVWCWGYRYEGTGATTRPERSFW